MLLNIKCLWVVPALEGGAQEETQVRCLLGPDVIIHQGYRTQECRAHAQT